ncbi:GNAT family N-acetyltransferase [Leucobacter albus]|uniref:GNAT family N-acetyltransferase n=1 Tax=Leucobacter albus TaxID=272210 RepID=A0ABW3TQL5_9MICO
MSEHQQAPSVLIAEAERYLPDVHGLIEAAADELFREHFGAFPWNEAAPPPPPHGKPERLLEATQGGAVVGFATLIESGEYLHLEQLSVSPDAARRGIGRALVDAAIDTAWQHGFAAVTLRTFADVPWNAPFYARLGFAVVDAAPSAFHERLVATEAALGLLEHGPRVHMVLRPPMGVQAGSHE